MYCERYREKVREQNRSSYHKCDKRDRLGYTKEYYRKNIDRLRQSYQDNRERHLSYYYKNREKNLERLRQAYQNNREYYDAKKRRRRALQYNALGKWEITEAEHVAARHKIQDWRCFYCGVQYRNTFHREHKTPLVRGGAHSPKNIVLSCAHCNLSKGSKTEKEYRAFLDTKNSA